jgi:hypothetical protein
MLELKNSAFYPHSAVVSNDCRNKHYVFIVPVITNLTFLVVVVINADYFPKQHQPFDLCNGCSVFLF